MEVLSRMKLKSWAFNGPAVLAEGDLFHVIDAWCYLGTARTQDHIEEVLLHGNPRFDKDTYRILVKHVNEMRPLNAKSNRLTKNKPKLKTS
jgi:DNA polymerase-3 subunit epsilon